MKPRERRPVGALVATAIVHIAVLALLTSVFEVPVLNLFRSGPAQPREEQVITFLTPPPAPPAPVAPAADVPRADTATRADTGGPPAAEPPALLPPGAVPVGIARAGADTATRDTLVGRGSRADDPLSGLRVGGTDPRLRGVVGRGPEPVGAVRAPRFLADSAASEWVAAYWDSVARAQGPPRRAASDWTVKRGDDTYGIDPQFIYFGKFKLPTALLAMLPITAQANPTVYERNRALNAMREDIMYHAMRARNEDDFNASVDRIRARIDRERAAKKGGK